MKLNKLREYEGSSIIDLRGSRRVYPQQSLAKRARAIQRKRRRKMRPKVK